MRRLHLHLHHLIKGGFIKTRQGFVDPKKHHKSHLSNLMTGLRFGSGTPAVKKSIDEIGGGFHTKKRITPLKYRF